MCDSPVVIQCKHLGSAIAAPQRVRNCITVRAKPRFSNIPGHCALVSSSRVSWWSSVKRRPMLPHPNHATGVTHPSLWQPIPATGMAGAGWGQGCSALWLPLQRGRELSAAKGPEWATCEMAGYAGDKCVPLMGTCFSDLL